MKGSEPHVGEAMSATLVGTAVRHRVSLGLSEENEVESFSVYTAEHFCE